MRLWVRLSVLWLLAIAGSLPASAHEVHPGYLELAEVEPGRYDVLWKVPRRAGLHLRLAPILPEFCRELAPRSTHYTANAAIQRWRVASDRPLAGGTLRVEGLESTITDVLVRVVPLEGRALTTRLQPSSSEFVFPEAPSLWQTARAYLGLGVEHMLGGIDHLLFVLALMLIVKDRLTLLKAVTAFTLGHSLTLAGATLGWVHVPAAPVEAVIALSIVFLACELVYVRVGHPSLTYDHAWIVALIFGLLHGFGFAGALSELGLPEGQIPFALFLFNVGVELGQLMFIAAALLIFAVGRRLLVEPPNWLWRVPAYSIGTVAAFWTVQRVVLFW